jgi:histidinol-phosphatase (PHP family)
MVKAGGFDILAHLDLVKKNNGKLRFFSPQEGEYIKLVDETADVIAQARSTIPSPEGGPGSPVMGLIVEVNTGGLNRGYIDEPYPSLAILRLLKERDIPLTINADAHAPEHLDGGYETAREAIQNAGCGAALVFKGRKDGMAVWRPGR